MLFLKRYLKFLPTAFLALLMGYLCMSLVSTKRTLDKKEAQNEALNRHLVKLEGVNSKNLETLKKFEFEHNKSLEKLKALHEKNIKREMEYAVQKEKIKHLQDGNVSSVLRDTFDFLRKQTSKTDSADTND